MDNGKAKDETTARMTYWSSRLVGSLLRLQFVLLAYFCSLFASFRHMPFADRINWLS
jgi:hypothetical protein